MTKRKPKITSEPAVKSVRCEVYIDGGKVDFVVRSMKQMTGNPSEAMAILMAAYMQICEESTHRQMTQLEMANIAHRMIITMEDETVPDRGGMH